jgi:hypothetical protein
MTGTPGIPIGPRIFIQNASNLLNITINLMESIGGYRPWSGVGIFRSRTVTGACLPFPGENQIVRVTATTGTITGE